MKRDARPVVLLTGGVVGVINWKVNLAEISNAIAIWYVVVTLDMLSASNGLQHE